ncbi:Ribosomal RNA small subunit methyltransferase E [Chlamydiales bacterium STE3]|nr:Ribosomal RNA small subunit methyltransferase E [Chlamydiales bacterium STE3]
MPEKRFYLAGELTPHSRRTLENEEVQHLKVMRCREGDCIEVINGCGALARAKIYSINKRDVHLDILSVYLQDLPNFEIVLAQALPRLNRLDTILEKCTELGVAKIYLFPGEHSEKKDLSTAQNERIQNILIAATKQCGRLYVPSYVLMPPLKKWAKPKLLSFYGQVSPSARLFKNAWEHSLPKNGVIFFVGPEQGFSQAEESQLHAWGTIGVKLHSNILRTDTAPITALSLISHFADG